MDDKKLSEIAKTDDEILAEVKAMLHEVMSEFVGQTLTPYIIETVRENFIKLIKDR